MNLEEFGLYLKRKREEQSISYSWLHKHHNISRSIIQHIESGENYVFSSLIDYVDILGCVLVVDSIVFVEVLDTLGIYLAEKRRNLNLSVREFSKKSHLSSQQINLIETGKNFYKSSLDKYLQIVDLKFDCIDAFEYLELKSVDI